MTNAAKYDSDYIVDTIDLAIVKLESSYDIVALGRKSGDNHHADDAGDHDEDIERCGDI